MAKPSKKPHITYFSKADRPVFYLILLICIFIIVFGLLTLAQPHWLRNLSAKGRTEEALVMINEGNRLSYEAHNKNSAELFKAAALQYQAALAVDTANIEATHNLATVYTYLGMTREALALYHKLLEGDEVNHPVVYINLGDLYERLNDPQKALRYYKIASEMNPWNPYPMRKYGLYLFSNGRIEESITVLQKALEQVTDIKMAYAQSLFTAYRLVYLEKDEETASLIKDLLNKNDFSSDISRFDNKIFTSLNMNNKQVAFCHFYLGDAYLAMLDTSSAIANYNACLQIDPGFQSDINKRLRQP